MTSSEAEQTTREYAPISSDEHTPGINAPIITRPHNDDLPAVDIPGLKKKGKSKKKKKGAYFFCCSNVTFDTEEGKAKALSMLENGKSRSCFMMCFSNFEVGSKNCAAGYDSKTSK